MSRLSFADALDQALELLEQGQPLEACIRQFPEYADELRPLLQVSDDLLRLADVTLPPFEKTRVEPDWEALLADIPQQRPSWMKSRANVLVQLFQSLRLHPVQRVASLCAAIIILLVLGWRGSAESAPHTPLYPIKRIAEQVQAVAVRDPETETAQHIEFAQRRLNEFQTLALAQHLDSTTTDLLSDALVQTDHALAAAKESGAGHAVYVKLVQLLAVTDASIKQLSTIVPPAELSEATIQLDKLRSGLAQAVAEAEADGNGQPVTQLPAAMPEASATGTETRTPTATRTSVIPVSGKQSTPSETSSTSVPSPTAVPIEPTVGQTAVVEEPAETPTLIPTRLPTAVPTEVPSPVPTTVPTHTPTAVPTVVPTAVPTLVPTAVPTAVPTLVPTAVPTAVPTPVPTAVPTVVPTPVPTAVPTVVPTPTATQEPTALPTVEPTVASTVEPTVEPTTPTVEPTTPPTVEPTVEPTVASTVETPIPSMTAVPDEQPTVVPVPTIVTVVPEPMIDSTPTKGIPKLVNRP